MIRLSQIKLSLEEHEKDLPPKICKTLRIEEADLLQMQIFKKSIDARRKDRITFAYTIDVSVRNESKLLKQHPKLQKSPDRLVCVVRA